jgi:hypothetical protein
MAIPRTYATAGAFRRALEERLKSMSKTEQIDINRLRRQVTIRSGRPKRMRGTLLPLLEHAVADVLEFRVLFYVGAQF